MNLGLILMDYHIIFIIMSFILLIYVFELVFRENNPRSVIAAMIICALNSILCVIIYLGFFGIGIIGYTTTGTIEANLYEEMYPLFMFFFGMYWINVIFLFWCWYHLTHHLLIENQKNKKF